VVSASKFDFVIVGGGAAGLSLALRLIDSPLADCSMLIVDRDWNAGANRTWAFWTDRPTPLDALVSCSWQRLRIMTPSLDITRDMNRYRYAVIRGSEFHRHALATLATHPNVTIREGVVERILDGKSSAVALTAVDELAGQWVFDSRFTRESTGSRQSFLGWEIHTQRDIFNPRVPTLMDFRTQQASASCFVYTLPLSTRDALVEHVACGAVVPDNNAQRAALTDYLRPVGDYCIVREEAGSTPLTVKPFPRRAGRRVMTIGIAAGRVKPSTGYAFARIQRDCEAIVESLVRTGEPFTVPADSARHRRYDRALLDTLKAHPQRIQAILGALFTGNPLDAVFRFLDERTRPWQEARLAATLPAWFWLKALPVPGEHYA
jgi:lycopene beta-cyclase